MKTLSLALSAITIFTFSAFSKDGITSGKIYSDKDKTTPIGDCVSLTERGNIVYQRIRFDNAKDFKFSEKFIVDGMTVLELRHLEKSSGFIFSSYKDYRVTTSVTDSQVDKIIVSSIKESAEYIWKRDSEGFFSNYTKRTRTPSQF